MSPIISSLGNYGVIGTTLICMADGTKKQIQDVNIDDEILSVNKTTSEITVEKVINLSSGLSTKLIRIESTIDNIWISHEKEIGIDRTGNDDPIYVLVKNLHQGGLIYAYDDQTITMSVIRSIVEVENAMVFNIMTDGNNTYIASNYIIGN
jgi:hypothetical protein